MRGERGTGPEGLVRECYRSGGYVYARPPGSTTGTAGVARVARLASNENPDPPPARALARAREALPGANRYPGDEVGAFIAALERYHGPYHFVAGAGMDGVIETILRLFVTCGDRVVISTPTFSFYGLAASALGAKVVHVQREDDFSVDTGKFIREARDAKVSFLCTPNNPTGTVTPAEDVGEILGEIPGILFLDNAYVEFCDEDYRHLVREHDNLVIGRTMSKAFSLAGLRVGYAFVPEWLVPYYNRAATPFSIPSVSAAAAAGALEDGEHVERARRRVCRLRERVSRECRFPVVPSGANFVLVDVSPRKGCDVAGILASRGVLVRSCESFPGLADHYVRVSIGEDWEMERFLREINSL